MYFEKPGIENTDTTLDLALRYAQGNGIRDVVIASTTGFAAQKLLGTFPKDRLNIVIVTHNTGFGKEAGQSFPRDYRQAKGGVNAFPESSFTQTIAHSCDYRKRKSS
jgi:uncharacterized protein